MTTFSGWPWTLHLEASPGKHKKLERVLFAPARRRTGDGSSQDQDRQPRVGGGTVDGGKP